MRYEITIDGAVAKVEISRLLEKKSEIYEATIESEIPSEARITVEKRDHETLVVSIGNKMYQVRQLQRSSSGVDFLLNGREVKAFRPNQYAQTSKGQEKSDIATVSEMVTSNFPAKVVSVVAAKGSALKEGDTILVVEAMKMEAQIKAPKKCKVLEVFVKEGDMVSRGSKLVQLKF
jgi:biotin carboxyl carrier protein